MFLSIFNRAEKKIKKRALLGWLEMFSRNRIENFLGIFSSQIDSCEKKILRIFFCVSCPCVRSMRTWSRPAKAKSTQLLPTTEVLPPTSLELIHQIVARQLSQLVSKGRNFHQTIKLIRRNEIKLLLDGLDLQSLPQYVPVRRHLSSFFLSFFLSFALIQSPSQSIRDFQTSSLLKLYFC